MSSGEINNYQWIETPTGVISKALPASKKFPSAMINLSTMIAAILILFLSFINEGSAIGSCSLDTINIGTQRSGREIGGQPEWNVQVINNCDCPQKKIVLSCPGFQTVEPVDPSILSKQGDTCLLINGGIVQPGSSVSFSYAWDPPVIMFPRFSVPQCPT